MNKDITVKETKEKKAELEKSISNLIHDFHEETGCLVEDIDLYHLDMSSYGGTAIFEAQGVRTTVKIKVEL